MQPLSVALSLAGLCDLATHIGARSGRMNELTLRNTSAEADNQAASHSLMIGSEYKKRAMPTPKI